MNCFTKILYTDILHIFSSSAKVISVVKHFYKHLSNKLLYLSQPPQILKFIFSGPLVRNELSGPCKHSLHLGRTKRRLFLKIRKAEKTTF